MNTTALLSAPAKRHSREFFHICFYFMWATFSSFGMKTLLIAYLVTQLQLEEQKGFAVFGTYSALLFGLPFIGGIISDRYLGTRKSIIWGSIMQIAGHGLLAIPLHQTFFLGLALVACGAGFGSGTVTALLGSLYDNTDTRRKDDAFIIFYMLVYFGAAMGALICGYVGQNISWHYGFGLAGLFMMVGLLNFIYKINSTYGAPPNGNRLKTPILLKINQEWVIYLASLVGVALVAMLFQRTFLMDIFMPPLTAASFLYILFISFGLTKKERRKIFAAMMVFLVNAIFVSFYSQSSGALNLFVLRNVDLKVGNMELPGLSINNFTPPFLLFLLTPFAIRLWNSLHIRNREPGPTIKFGISFLFMALCFLTLWLGCFLYQSTGLVPVLFLFTGYLFLECAELNIGPISYSLISKLSPPAIASTMMGLLYLSISLGEYLAGKLGATMSIPENITNPVLSLPFYTNIFLKIASGCGIMAVGMLFSNPLMKKWMQEVK